MFGREPHCNIDLLLHGVEDKLQSVPCYTADVIERMRLAHHIVRQKLDAQAAYMSHWYNRCVKPAQFCVGDKVRVFNDSVKPGHCPNVATVTQRINDVTYVVTCPAWRSDRVIHVDKLKRVETFPQ